MKSLTMSCNCACRNFHRSHLSDCIRESLNDLVVWSGNNTLPVDFDDTVPDTDASSLCYATSHQTADLQWEKREGRIHYVGKLELVSRFQFYLLIFYCNKYKSISLAQVNTRQMQRAFIVGTHLDTHLHTFPVGKLIQCHYPGKLDTRC